MGKRRKKSKDPIKKEELEKLDWELKVFRFTFMEYLSQLEDVEVACIEKILRKRWITIYEISFILNMSIHTLFGFFRFHPNIRQYKRRKVYYRTIDILHFILTNRSYFNDQNQKRFTRMIKNYRLDIYDCDKIDQNQVGKSGVTYPPFEEKTTKFA